MDYSRSLLSTLAEVRLGDMHLYLTHDIAKLPSSTNSKETRV